MDDLIKALQLLDRQYTALCFELQRLERLRLSGGQIRSANLSFQTNIERKRDKLKTAMSTLAHLIDTYHD